MYCMCRIECIQQINLPYWSILCWSWEQFDSYRLVSLFSDLWRPWCLRSCCMGTGNMTTVELVIPSPTKLALFSTFLDLASVLPKQDCSGWGLIHVSVHSLHGSPLSCTGSYQLELQTLQNKLLPLTRVALLFKLQGQRFSHALAQVNSPGNQNLPNHTQINKTKGERCFAYFIKNVSTLLSQFITWLSSKQKCGSVSTHRC